MGFVRLSEFNLLNITITQVVIYGCGAKDKIICELTASKYDHCHILHRWLCCCLLGPA